MNKKLIAFALVALILGVVLGRWTMESTTMSQKNKKPVYWRHFTVRATSPHFYNI